MSVLPLNRRISEEQHFPVRCICVFLLISNTLRNFGGFRGNSVLDFRGRRVCIGAAGSGTEVITTRVLDSYWIDVVKDLKRERLSVIESANAVVGSHIAFHPGAVNYFKEKGIEVK